MTQNVGLVRGPVKGPLPHLSLRQTAPSDWHQDRPAFAGDPFMDWESEPEPPREARWALKEPAGVRSPKN